MLTKPPLASSAALGVNVPVDVNSWNLFELPAGENVVKFDIAIP
jgi:hypothetical protein